MLNSVNERIKSMNKSANINVSGYPSVVSLNNKGEFVKDLSQDAAIKMLNTPMPNAVQQNVSMKNVSMKNVPMNVMESASENVSMKNVSMKNVPKNVMENVPKNVMESASENVTENSSKNVMENAPKNVKLPQTRVSEPILQLMGGNSFEAPLAPKYLGGSLYKSLSSSPYQLANPLTLFKSLSKTHRKSNTRKSKSRK